jgi:hypothetical protein
MFKTYDSGSLERKDNGFGPSSENKTLDLIFCPVSTWQSMETDGTHTSS